MLWNFILKKLFVKLGKGLKQVKKQLEVDFEYRFSLVDLYWSFLTDSWVKEMIMEVGEELRV